MPRLRRSLLVLGCIPVIAGTAVAATTATVGFTPSSTKAPNQFTIDVNPSKLVPAGEFPSEVMFSLPRGTTFDAHSRSKTCLPAQAAREQCPGAAMVGFGHVVVHVTYPVLVGGQTDVLGYLEGYLGPPLQPGDPASITFEVELLGVDRIKQFLRDQFGFTVRTELGVAARVQRIHSGPYGLRVTVPGIQGGLAVPPGLPVTATVTRFKLQLGAVLLKKVTFFHHITVVGLHGVEHLRIRDHRLELHYLLRDPATCNGSWPFQLQVAFGAGVVTDVLHSRCRRAAVPLIPPPTPAPSDRG